MLYVLAAHRSAARFAKKIGALVYPRIASFAREVERTDADPKEDAEAKLEAKRESSERAARLLAKQMREEVADDSEDDDFITSMRKTASKTEAHSKTEFKRLGIDVRKEPNMTPLIDGWRKDNVSLIKNMHEEQVSKIEGILRDGFGRHPRSLAKDIENQVEGVTRSRSELIARDQVLTLHAKITRHRQQAAGIKEYVWTTSNDERVRPEHEELDGETFSWDEGGDDEEGHPGEAVNCRCVAFPVLPELEDEDEDDDDEDEDEDDDDEDEDEDDDEDED